MTIVGEMFNKEVFDHIIVSTHGTVSCFNVDDDLRNVKEKIISKERRSNELLSDNITYEQQTLFENKTNYGVVNKIHSDDGGKLMEYIINIEDFREAVEYYEGRFKIKFYDDGDVVYTSINATSNALFEHEVEDTELIEMSNMALYDLVSDDYDHFNADSYPALELNAVVKVEYDFENDYEFFVNESYKKGMIPFKDNDGSNKTLSKEVFNQYIEEVINDGLTIIEESITTSDYSQEELDQINDLKMTNYMESLCDSMNHLSVDGSEDFAYDGLKVLVLAGDEIKEFIEEHNLDSDENYINHYNDLRQQIEDETDYAFDSYLPFVYRPSIKELTGENEAVYTLTDELEYCDLTGEPFENEEGYYYFQGYQIKEKAYEEIVDADTQNKLYDYDEDDFYYSTISYENPITLNPRYAELPSKADDFEPLISENQINETIDELIVEDKFTFVLTNEDEVDYNKPHNGNNGNYEVYDVYFKGNLVASDWAVHDWNVTRNDYLYDSNQGVRCWIEDNKVFEEHEYDNQPNDVYVMNRDGEWQEVSDDDYVQDVDDLEI